MTSIGEQKQALRRDIATKKKAVFSDPTYVMAKSGMLWSAVESMEEFRNARTILLYSALADEIPTDAFIAKWSGTKRLVLPVVVPEGLQLREYHPDKMVKGFRGIMEPSDESPLVEASEIEFAIIPAVAYAADGSRLGRGGGYYDRLLPKLECITVGMALPFQMLPSVPLEAWDSKVNIVLGL